METAWGPSRRRRQLGELVETERVRNRGFAWCTLHPDVEVVKRPGSHRTRRNGERDYTEMSSGGSSRCRLPGPP